MKLIETNTVRSSSSLQLSHLSVSLSRFRIFNSNLFLFLRCETLFVLWRINLPTETTIMKNQRNFSRRMNTLVRGEKILPMIDFSFLFEIFPIDVQRSDLLFREQIFIINNEMKNILTLKISPRSTQLRSETEEKGFVSFGRWGIPFASCSMFVFVVFVEKAKERRMDHFH